MAMENIENLKQELTEINKWEKDQQKIHIWEMAGRMPFWILDKLTPSYIQKKLDRLFKEIAKFVEYGGRYLINKDRLLSSLKISTLEEIRTLPLQDLDRAAEDLVKRRGRFAGIQGAATGAGGLAALAADIPLLLGTSLKVLQEIAVLYGYDPREEKERLFIIQCLQFAYAEGGGKKAVLKEIEASMNERTDRETASQLKGWREVFQTYRDHIGWKKLFQAIPIVGIVIGAVMNKSMIGQVAETGMMFYKKRRIKEILAEPDEG